MNKLLPCMSISPTRPLRSLAEDALAGLFHRPMSLPAKYFYDVVGSALFDEICRTPEYYPTRTEATLLAEVADGIIAHTQPLRILELGSGMSRKTRHLLDACATGECQPTYVPFDVCSEVLQKSGTSLTRDYAWLRVEPAVGDYTAGLGNLPLHGGRNLLLFLGGTIGNFSHAQALDFLREVRAIMEVGDYFLIGADRVKDPARLHAAYNDAAGITATFNFNLLSVLNRGLGADFVAEHFRHHACYNPAPMQIEMYLISACGQRVNFPALRRHLVLEEGDAILTEISRKFTAPALEGLLHCAGFAVEAHYASDDDAYSLVLARPDRNPGFPRVVK